MIYNATCCVKAQPQNYLVVYDQLQETFLDQII